MNKLKKILNMAFNGKEYDDMKGWETLLQIVFLPLFILKLIPFTPIPNKSGKTEWAIIIALIVAALIGLSYLIANIISAI